jgi:hypothetical protein
MLAQYYDPETRWGRAFGVVDRANYSPPLYQHRGQDLRKTDPTGSYSVPTDVVSLSAGRISHLYTATATGREVVVDTGRARGRYEIHCHSAYFPGLGAPVGPGTVITRNATAGERPGTGWTAPHDHFVISDYPDAAHVPSRPVYDPRPFILAALAGPAGGGAQPFDPEEDDVNDRQNMILEHLYQELLPGKAGVKTQGGVNKVINDTYAAAVAARNASQSLVGDFQAGEAGKRPAGRLLGLLDSIFRKPGAEVSAEQVRAIADAVAAQLGKQDVTIDYDRIAKAVNDDAARRLAG